MEKESLSGSIGYGRELRSCHWTFIKRLDQVRKTAGYKLRSMAIQGMCRCPRPQLCPPHFLPFVASFILCREALALRPPDVNNTANFEEHVGRSLIADIPDPDIGRRVFVWNSGTLELWNLRLPRPLYGFIDKSCSQCLIQDVNNFHQV